MRGANNLAKTLYRKENKELIETIERYTDGLIFTIQMNKIVETLSAAKAQKKRRKRESICRYSKSAYADHRGNADGIKEGI